jgi:hypothetical protein
MQNNKLLEDVGFTGDGEAVKAILQGTYDFPPETDVHTKLLFTEAAVLFCSLGDDGIVDWIQNSDFQQFWLHAREKTESSKSLLHFGHYMAGATDDVITDMHVTSLNTTRECETAPTRWSSSITVLLEKVFGVRLITKLRAICLLEADFNWVNKLIFAHRLEQFCRKHDIIPAEQFAKSKSNCEEASLVKNLICDNSRILHNSLALTGADLDQCFDRGAGPVVGVVARAHGVSQTSTKLMLSTMQHMQYFIKSGFGIADTPSFGGSEEQPLMGLGQGSGAAPTVMRCVITLADLAYQRLGHGINIKTAVSARVFLLAAIIYVDDTDLLHWARFYGITDEEFFNDIQQATLDWSKIVQATGGSLKQSKSFWHLLSWKFVHGIPTLKSKAELPQQPMFIDQPDGVQLPVPLRDNSYTKKTLGVYSNPLNCPKAPLEKLKEKGLDWVDALRVRPLERRDVKLSLTTQQYPKWGYGLSSLYASPQQLDKTIGKVYYQALPFLGFNRCINKVFRTLPTAYQGAGLKQWSIEKLGKDISMLLRHWDSDSTLGRVYRLVFESFQMEVGLDGNIFDRNYNRLGYLASHSWFKILWQYCDHYKVKLRFDPKFHIKPTRVGDRALMELFLEQRYQKHIMERLNRVRRFLRVHSLADIVLADGCTVDTAHILSRTQGHSTRTFSWEQPTPTNFDTWKSAIRDITSASYRLPTPLGPYSQEPHRSYTFFTTDDKSVAYRIRDNEYDTYHRDDTLRSTRSGLRYRKISTSTGRPTYSKYASVCNITNDHLTLQSTCPMFHNSTSNTSFLETLSSTSNPTLWDNLQVDGC